MVVKMTNRLLAVVIMLTVFACVLVHSTQGPQPRVRDAAPVSFKLPQVKLPAPSDIRMTANWVSNQTLSLFDPKSEPIRSAYLRDRQALEQLRNDPNSTVRGNLDAYITDQEARLDVLEQEALTELSNTSLSGAGIKIQAMHQLVTQARAAVLAKARQAGKQSTGAQGQSGQSGKAGQSGQSGRAEEKSEEPSH
jgi:hypothetical protein